MNTQVVATPNAPGAIGPYSQAILVDAQLIFTAGQIPIDPATGSVVPGDVKAQTRQVFKNLRAILQAAGSDLSGIVKTTVFLKDMNEFAAMNEVYAEFFPSAPPARSTVEVARLPRDVNVEIEAIAVVQTKH